MKEIKGTYQGKGKKIAIVVSRFNELISSKLLEGCVDELEKQGVEDKDITIIWIPGAFEAPQLLAKLIENKKYHAYVVLSVIIRGDTPHFDYIASELSKGITSISLERKVPIAFGVIIADTLEQAIERAGTKQGNRGRDAARNVVEMANVYEQI